MNPTILPTSNPSPLEPRNTRPADKRPTERGSTWASFFISLVVHINLMLILALTYRALQDEEPPTLVIDTTFTPGEEQDVLNANEMPNDVQIVQEEKVFADAAPIMADDLIEREEPRLDLAGLSGSGGADGFGGLGIAGGVGFFGTTAQGKSFVFVVDCSGSMEGSRFRRAMIELRKSINQLDPDQRFQIVFFNDQPIPLVHSKYGHGLIPAGRVELQEVHKWIGDRSAGGGTVPDEALKQALALKPDVVFFLTDADQIPRKVRTLIAETNKHGSTVHTIAFGHKGGETLMQGIAADHHGRYRFVP